MNRSILLTLLLCSALLAFFEEDEDRAAKTLQVPKVQRHVKVSVVKPKAADVPIETHVRGVVEAAMEYSVNAQAEGILHNRVMNGTRVEKGAIIATLENPRLNNALRLAKSRIRLFRGEIDIEKNRLKSIEEMLHLGIVSNNDYLMQQNLLKDKMLMLKQAESEMENLIIQKHKAVLKAPVPGFVSNLAAEGNYIGFGGMICRIQSHKVRITLFVTQSVARTLHRGEAVHLAMGAKTVRAVVRQILPITSDNLVHIIADPKESLPLGLNLEAAIVTEKQSGWILPKAAIVLVQNRPAVFIIDNSVAHLHFVTVQKDMIDKVLVSDHLRSSDAVALKNAYMLHDRTVVEVVP